VIHVRRESGGFSPAIRKAGAPAPLSDAVLQRLLSRGWVLPDAENATVREWLAAQLTATKAAGRALTAAEGRTLTAAILTFLRSRDVRGLRSNVVESAIRDASSGSLTVEQAVSRIWGTAAEESAIWQGATDALAGTLSSTWTRSAAVYAHALAASKTMRKWIEETRGGDLGSIVAEFGRPNPLQIPAFRKEALKLVQGLDTTARRGMTRVISRGLQEGRGPLDVAREVRGLPRFALTEQQSVAVQNYRRELEAGQWGAARARGLHDQRFRVQPIDQDAIDALVDRYGERMAMYRSNTIARTEMMRATNRGARAVWDDLIEQGVVREDRMLRYWVTAPENASGAGIAWNAPTITGPCDICAPIPAANPDGRFLDEPFDYEGGQIDEPPVHPNCRCVLFYRPKFLTLAERGADGA